jgi:hypothetical protein
VYFDRGHYHAVRGGDPATGRLVGDVDHLEIPVTVDVGQELLAHQ